MMNLRYLVDNRELAVTMLKNWDYDIDNMEIMNQYRISSSAIYPFTKDGEIRILRFFPSQETSSDLVERELEFIQFLKANNFPVADIINSKNNNIIEELDTKWGKYNGSVFSRVNGKRLDKITLTDDILFEMGKTLANLHELSVKYERRDKIKTHKDCISDIKKYLTDKDINDSNINKEIQILENFFNSLDKDTSNYGLVHFDYELDNLFYDEKNNKISVIDFGDMMYHWYITDVVNFIENFYEELSESVSEKQLLSFKGNFIDGYKSIRNLEDKLLNKSSMIIRFSKLYKYINIRKAMLVNIKDKPPWMSALSKRLNEKTKELYQKFGKT
ncbi:phosphotransferase [Clostridiaceae bacterium M8S5]|nr:phosphotransferase [Clostridiaceae bacterium M8S5]